MKTAAKSRLQPRRAHKRPEHVDENTREKHGAQACPVPPVPPSSAVVLRRGQSRQDSIAHIDSPEQTTEQNKHVFTTLQPPSARSAPRLRSVTANRSAVPPREDDLSAIRGACGTWGVAIFSADRRVIRAIGNRPHVEACGCETTESEMSVATGPSCEALWKRLRAAGLPDSVGNV